MAQQPINPAQVEKCIKGLDFPADKQEVIEYANQHGATSEIRQALQSLPERSFDSPVGLTKAIGEMNRSQR
ncbi:hypothetical protein KSD_75310 [Ktedonobacter sp. SOSP1-85]|uniref:DUF2795 domain-containing protein n=1 Tax=Ktedonobacter sp. SOSP1-85 TaxID=2778367 RepID=UPI0019165ABE|nr:DUF2795 domain-containing protein [Ktedonobacter sp. SOSP1-85]GHO79760.1 hypothetical protein KSD_75310 [Ktedonobacter sp. SOSP1-85]